MNEIQDRVLVVVDSFFFSTILMLSVNHRMSLNNIRIEGFSVSFITFKCLITECNKPLNCVSVVNSMAFSRCCSSCMNKRLFIKPHQFLLVEQLYCLWIHTIFFFSAEFLLFFFRIFDSYLLMTQWLQTLRIICWIFVDFSDQFNKRFCISPYICVLFGVYVICPHIFEGHHKKTR